MLDSIIDFAFGLLLFLGLPALFVLFVLKGALVGKLFPTTILLPGYVIAISASPLEIGGIILTTSIGYLLGQMIIYGGSRRHGLSFIESAPRIEISEPQIRRSEELFAAYGGAGIFFTGFIPYLRGLILIPAGLASYPVGQLVLYVYASTLLYHSAIVVLGIWIVRAVV